MSSRVATRKLGAILASIVVSSYAVFGHDAWAPEPALLATPLGATAGATAAAVGVITSAPTTVVKWPGTWTAGSPEAGKPCSTTALGPWTETTWVIERQGNYARCTMWITEGAKLDAGLSGTTGGTVPATTLVTNQATFVVQFPATWTHDTTVVAETYCSPWSSPAGSAVGAFIVRAGEFAKCLSY
jgi:hypothetical protein